MSSSKGRLPIFWDLSDEDPSKSTKEMTEIKEKYEIEKETHEKDMDTARKLLNEGRAIVHELRESEKAKADEIAALRQALQAAIDTNINLNTTLKAQSLKYEKVEEEKEMLEKSLNVLIDKVKEQCQHISSTKRKDSKRKLRGKRGHKQAGTTTISGSETDSSSKKFKSGC